MLGISGLDFCGDETTMDIFPNSINDIKNIKITNGVYDHFNITKDTTFSYTNVIPNWDFDTIIDCDFKNNINGGNTDFTLSTITSILIKRRKKGNSSWITIKKIDITKEEDTKFSYLDTLVPSGDEFEWAVVPVLNGAEGNYIIKSLETYFNGVFISDINTIVKLYENVNYGEITSVQSSGLIQTIGGKYPIMIKNSKADYERGSLTADIYGSSQTYDVFEDRIEINEKTLKLEEFLKNGKPKMMRDYSGNCWILIVEGNPKINKNLSLGKTSIGFNWVEQGKYDNQLDLYKNGLVEVR